MQQKTYQLDEHQISLNDVDNDALYVMEKLRHAGFTAYLVGGGVRDLLLKRKPKDFDISTSAKPEEIKQLFRNCILIGRRFRLAHIRFGKKILEVSTFRSGDTQTEELIIRDNVWGSEEEDVTRRDFTINGLFYDPSTQTIIDYVNGYPDIQKKLLRTIGQPFVRFKQDPVRMIRLLKFQARFGLEVNPDAHIALLECRSEIVKSSPARILEELLRMLESGHAASFFKLMSEHGMLQLMLPALAHFMETPEGSDIYAYLQETDTAIQENHFKIIERPILMCCLVYPILAKRIQTQFIDRERIPHLGEISQESYKLITEVFHPFFQIPRRMRMSMVSIITSQYRLTPVEKKRLSRIRIPQDPEFGLALQFLKIRSCIEPGLQLILKEWQEVFESGEKPIAKRRRSRRRPPK